MNKATKFLIITFLSTFNLSMYFDPTKGILDQQDLYLVKNQLPLLTSMKGSYPEWESYGEWVCFPIENIKIHFMSYCRPEGCNPLTDYEVPSFEVNYEGQDHEFNYELETPDNNNRIFEEWKELLEDESAVCFYAARFPPEAFSTELEQSIWSLYNLKTKKGIWLLSEVP